MALSRQTPPDRAFRYNPLDGAMLHLFSADHNPAKTRRLNMVEIDATEQFYRSIAQTGQATYMVLLDKRSKQTTVMLYGSDGRSKRVEDFSVKHHGKAKKQTYGAY